MESERDEVHCPWCGAPVTWGCEKWCRDDDGSMEPESRAGSSVTKAILVPRVRAALVSRR